MIKELDISEIKTTKEEIEIDFQKMEQESFISVEEELKRQPIAISIGKSNFKGEDYPIAFGSYGDYSCIVGSSKSRKTFLKSALVACYIGGKAQNNFSSIKGHDTHGKFVVDIDTEQSKYHSQMVFKRVCELVGTNPDCYKTYSLREYSPKQRLAFIDWLILESPLSGKIGLLSIDGFADLVDDYNSLEQSNNLQQKLLSWTTEGKCHITGILHKNFGSDKPVGHVGSAVLKKAESVIFTDKDGDFTKVECRYSRNFPFEGFRFGIDNNGLPYEVDLF